MRHLRRDVAALSASFIAFSACAEGPSSEDATPELGVTTEAVVACTSVSEDPSARSADWPSAGHDWAHTGHNFAETALSRSSVPDLDVAWQHSFELGYGSPIPVMATAVAASGVAYMVDAAGYAHARNLSDGTLLWSSKVSDAEPDPVFRAVVQSGPVVTDDALYVGDADATLHRLDRSTGAVTWSVNLDPNPDALIQGDLATAGAYVVFGVSALENENTYTGDLTMRGSVVAVDRDEGTLGWQLFTTSDQTQPNPRYGAGVGVWSSPAIDFWRNRVFIGTGQYYEPGSSEHCSGNGVDLSDSLLGISLCDGALVSRRQFTAGDVFGLNYPEGKDFDVGTPPNLFEFTKNRTTTLAVGVGDKEGTYYVLDRRTLRTLWSRRVAQGSVLGGFQATAAYANGVVFVAAHESLDGTSLGSQIPPGEAATFLGTREGLLTVQSRARTRVLALDVTNGNVKWEVTLPGAATFAPLIVANGVLFHGDANGGLRAFDTANGSVLWQYQLGGFELNGGGYLGGNMVTGLSLSRGRLLVSSVPFQSDAPTGLTAFGVP